MGGGQENPSGGEGGGEFARYKPHLLPRSAEAGPGSRMAQWQCVHLVNEKTWRKDTLPYSQTDDKTYLCCRTPRLADTNTNNNIRAASWFPLSRTQWKEGMSNFKWNSSKRGEKGQSGCLQPIGLGGFPSFAHDLGTIHPPDIPEPHPRRYRGALHGQSSLSTADTWFKSGYPHSLLGNFELGFLWLGLCNT